MSHLEQCRKCRYWHENLVNEAGELAPFCDLFHGNGIAVPCSEFRPFEDADFFVLVGGNHLKERFTGANIELGYALACGKKCFSIGKIRNCVFYSLITRVNTVDDLMRLIK